MERLSYVSLSGVIVSLFTLGVGGCTHSSQTTDNAANLNISASQIEADLATQKTQKGAKAEAEERIENAAKLASANLLKLRSNLNQPFSVSVKALSVRSGPSLSSKKIASLKRGTLVKVVEIQNQWARFDENKWIALRYLKLSAPK